MPELGLHHIDQISREISKQEISFSHLLHDLIDHVCCDVEEEMQKGLSFSDAYRKVKQKMGARRLIEIQEETLYLVDTKYRYMKNLMKTSAVAGTILLGFATLFKIQHWPLAGTIMTLGAILLALVFMPSALGVLWKETHSRKRLFLFISAFLTGLFFIFGTLFKIQHWSAGGLIISLAVLSSIFLFIPALLTNRFSDKEKKSKRAVYVLGAAGIIFYVTGMFFKIQHWPLSTMLMVIGVFILCMVTFPWYTWLTWKDESNIRSGFIYIIIGSLLIIVPGALVNLNLQNTYERGFFSNLEQQQLIYNSLYDNSESRLNLYRDSLKYREMEKLHSKTTTLLTFVGNLQVKMVEESEGKPGLPATNPVLIKLTENGPDIQYKRLSRPFKSIAPIRDNLLPGCSSRQELDTELKEYMNYISGFIPGEDLKKYTTILQLPLSFSKEMVEDNVISLFSAFHYLEILKNSVLTLESYALSVIEKSKNPVNI
jgi:hypothetical protein